jgi:hypothetical protein
VGDKGSVSRWGRRPACRSVAWPSRPCASNPFPSPRASGEKCPSAARAMRGDRFGSPVSAARNGQCTSRSDRHGECVRGPGPLTGSAFGLATSPRGRGERGTQQVVSTFPIADGERRTSAARIRGFTSRWGRRPACRSVAWPSRPCASNPFPSPRFSGEKCPSAARAMRGGLARYFPLRSVERKAHVAQRLAWGVRSRTGTPHRLGLRPRHLSPRARGEGNAAGCFHFPNRRWGEAHERSEDKRVHFPVGQASRLPFRGMAVPTMCLEPVPFSPLQRGEVPERSEGDEGWIGSVLPSPLR